MKISILEPGTSGHYTYVEAIANIFSAEFSNQIDIYVTSLGFKNLKHLENNQIHFHITEPSNDWLTFFSKISSLQHDLIIPVTFEPVSNESFDMLKGFIETNWNAPIWFIVHNIDFWFEQSLPIKIKRLFISPISVNALKYRFKQVFLFPQLNKSLVKKVLNSNGKFGVLSSTIADSLKQYVPFDKIKIIPFSVYEKNHEERIDSKVVNNSLVTPIRIAIPGYVSSVRRDYDSVFNSLQKFHALKEKCSIELLGGINPNEGGVEVINNCKKLISNGYQVIFHDLPKIDLLQFDIQLKLADFILGNLHINQQAGSAYGKSKESGIPYTMIKMAKPGFLPVGYPVEPEIEPAVVRFNSYDHLMEIISDLINHPGKIAELQNAALEMANYFSAEKVYQRLFTA